MIKTIRVALPEEGPDKYVEIRNPLFMRVKEQRALQQRDGEDETAYSNRLLNFVVMGGNITAEDGRFLQYPLTEADIDELTTYTISQIMNAFSEAMKSVQPSKN